MRSITFFWEHLALSERVVFSSTCSCRISVKKDANQKRTPFSTVSRTNSYRNASFPQFEKTFQPFNWNNVHTVCGKHKWLASHRSTTDSLTAAPETHSPTISYSQNDILHRYGIVAYGRCIAEWWS